MTDKIRFQYDSDVNVSVEINSVSTLPEVFDAFESFLRAASFTIPYDRQIDLVDVDE
jgi:hypothetical protein